MFYLSRRWVLDCCYVFKVLFDRLTPLVGLNTWIYWIPRQHTLSIILTAQANTSLKTWYQPISIKIVYRDVHHFWYRCGIFLLFSYHLLYGIVVVYTDLSGKEPLWQVAVVRSGSLGGVMASTLAQNARDEGFIVTLGAIFPILSHPWHWCHDQDPTKLCAVWLLNLPCVCMCKVIACMYVILSIKRLTIPGRRV